MREDVFKSNVFGAFVIWLLLSASLLIVMPKFVSSSNLSAVFFA